jgi:hypothetical protein
MRAFALFGITLFLGLTSLEAGQESREIQWRSGSMTLSPATASLDLLAKAGKGHVVVQFRAPLSEDDRKAVEALGSARCLPGSDAYFAAIPAGVDTVGLRALPSLLAVGADPARVEAPFAASERGRARLLRRGVLP